MQRKISLLLTLQPLSSHPVSYIYRASCPVQKSHIPLYINGFVCNSNYFVRMRGFAGYMWEEVTTLAEKLSTGDMATSPLQDIVIELNL